MNEKKDFLARLGARLDLPREALPGGFSLLLSGREELFVRGRARILSYRENEIVLLVENKKICVTGSCLFCVSLGKENLRIIGTVMGVNFKMEGENEG